MKGRLLQLGAKLRIRGDEETFWMSLEELHQWGTSLRQVESAMRVHQHANAAEFRKRFETLTGKAWDAGKRRPGKPKRGTNVSERKAPASKAA
jgi:allophanate hydrolase subunit 2